LKAGRTTREERGRTRRTAHTYQLGKMSDFKQAKKKKKNGLETRRKKKENSFLGETRFLSNLGLPTKRVGKGKKKKRPGGKN